VLDFGDAAGEGLCESEMAMIYGDDISRCTKER
jgi:hypothetical protein